MKSFNVRKAIYILQNKHLYEYYSDLILKLVFASEI